MRPPSIRAVGVAAATAMVAASAMTATVASAAPGGNGNGNGKGLAKGKSDVRIVPPDLTQGRKLGLDKSGLAKAKAKTKKGGSTGTATASSTASSTASAARVAATGDNEVGDTMTFLGLNDYLGRYQVKSFTLRSIGEHIQVWVADNRDFPAGDCRNDLGLTNITDAQVNNFVHEFDTNIYPKESANFSIPPALDGSKATITSALGLPADYYKVSANQADDIVVLVDNVRDANFYEPTTPDGQTYIAGFFSSQLNGYFDRNVMTIDAFDWLHRTGATPPDDSKTAAYQACSAALGQTSRPLGVSRPHLYEGTFAHEYQHLLEHYEDPDEVSWVNEGLSDYAQTLVGYVDTTVPTTSDKADGHLRCFNGYQPTSFGGPENSLTLWGDQGGPEILCDYGAAYSLMEYLDAHYGPAFMTALHRNDANGLAGLDAVLDQFGSTKSAMDTLHDWAAMAALDAQLDKGRKLTGGTIGDFTASTLTSQINWDNPQAYDTPGAPANGSDYVRLRDANGTYLRADQLNSITFTGAKTLEPAPLQWTVAANAPDNAPPSPDGGDNCGEALPAGTGGAALYSGCGADQDRSIGRQVTVPATGGSLTFDALWDIEEGWDFGFVQVSTDGGKTWTSLPTADTTSEHDAGAQASAVANLPGLTGNSGGWRTQAADLSAYAGKTILVGFRYITDPAANYQGLWVRNVSVAGTALPTDTLDGWKSYSQLAPTPVAGYTVQLIAYDDKGRSWIYRLPLDANFSATLSGSQLITALGRQATTVAAIVMQDDPTETITQQARYTLTVNGVTQPGG